MGNLPPCGCGQTGVTLQVSRAEPWRAPAEAGRAGILGREEKRAGFEAGVRIPGHWHTKPFPAGTNGHPGQERALGILRGPCPGKSPPGAGGGPGQPGGG